MARRYRWLLEYAERSRPDAREPLPIPERLTRGIKLRDVTFRYPGTDSPVLDRVSLELPAGSVVALEGENGAGKTTLVNLLSRFYEPDGGRILIDDIPIVVLERGRIKEEGTHEELMGLNGTYAELYNLQARAYR